MKSIWPDLFWFYTWIYTFFIHYTFYICNNCKIDFLLSYSQDHQTLYDSCSSSLTLIILQSINTLNFIFFSLLCFLDMGFFWLVLQYISGKLPVFPLREMSSVPYGIKVITLTFAVKNEASHYYSLITFCFHLLFTEMSVHAL